MNQPELGKKIAELRKAKSLTQEELVEFCNLNVRTLQRIESGVVSPRSYTLKTIFAALEYNINDSSENTPPKFNKSGHVISNLIEQFYRYVIDLFNLKTNTMKKVSILSTLCFILVISLFFIFSESNAQKSIESKYTETNGRGIIYLFPRGLSVHISNTKDTADYKFGEYLIQEYKYAIYFKWKLFGSVDDGDTVILDNGNLSIKKAFWKFVSSNGNGIIYQIPSDLTIKNLSVQKDNTERLYLSNQQLIQEHKNKIYLNNSFIGEAYMGDIVKFKKGTLSITKK